MRICVDAVYMPYQLLHDAVLVVERGAVVDVSEGGPCDVDGYAAASDLIDAYTHGCC